MFGSDRLLDVAIMMIERTHRVENLETSELAAMLAGPEPPLLFDIRTAGEYEKSHIETAIRIEPDIGQDDFETLYAALMAGRDIVLYCSVGQRSSELLERVESARGKTGAKSCRNLRGGIFRWYNEGRPVVDASGTTDDIHGYDPVWAVMVERRR
ncbi:Rhodanese domain protein [Chlorobium phaeobacteroides DSM 266]|jgi:rhodanese-related sulfurtransferase|uniref:Rhodanese domain protein n=1 Tax=Chlorobium phaeobacteroides (strain DSM 266 / SMG 266 / 2430) TaxID=290317 RepID=A1BGS0_CHLPD|nr:Rhodanese domain protein [Chlorobium phaeobacteroides DSM 266]MBV5326710.1 rhodanese-like domain-containing protein [Chlorobium sp.]